MNDIEKSIEGLIIQLHAKLDKAEVKYLAFDAKLDRIEKAKVASKWTPVWSFGLLAIVFWLGTYF